LEVSVDPPTAIPGLLESLTAAVRLGIEAADRPLTFGLQPVLELTLTLTDDAHIHDLNRTFRGMDNPTDVLSFSQLEGAAGFVPAPSGRLTLGDIVISLDTAARQGQSLEAEVRHLAVHGALHLLGYDHETDQDEARMNALANRALADQPVT
jgi:probable rRNA maturation factor